MLTEQHIREGLSRAYILAVAHRAGFNCSMREFDYGIDGTFHEIARIGSRHVESGFKIDFQAKASSSANLATLRDDALDYKLEAKSQRDLAMTAGTPRILILLLLPDDAATWLTTSEDALVLRRCAWWMSLRCQALTPNEQRVTVSIPRAQRFDVAALRSMMQRVREGEMP